MVTRQRVACLKLEVSILVVYTICPGTDCAFIVMWIMCWESRGIRMIIFISRMLTSGDLIPTRGTQRLSASMSATLFLPYIKRGFRASVTGFVDWGVLARDEKNLLNSQSYWGIGFSLNLRNDNLILKNVSIRFAFYPKGPPDIHSIEVNVSSRRKSGFYDYRVYKPDAIKYE